MGNIYKFNRYCKHEFHFICVPVPCLSGDPITTAGKKVFFLIIPLNFLIRFILYYFDNIIIYLIATRRYTFIHVGIHFYITVYYLLKFLLTYPVSVAEKSSVYFTYTTGRNHNVISF